MTVLRVEVVAVQKEREMMVVGGGGAGGDGDGDGDDAYLPLESALPLNIPTSLPSRASYPSLEPSLYIECVYNMRRS